MADSSAAYRDGSSPESADSTTSDKESNVQAPNRFWAWLFPLYDVNKDPEYKKAAAWTYEHDGDMAKRFRNGEDLTPFESLWDYGKELFDTTLNGTET